MLSFIRSRVNKRAAAFGTEVQCTFRRRSSSTFECFYWRKQQPRNHSAFSDESFSDGRLDHVLRAQPSCKLSYPLYESVFMSTCGCL